MKQCKKCGQPKDESEFRKYPDYTSGACKDCEREYHTQYLRKSKEAPLYLREELIPQGKSYCGRCEQVKPLIQFRKSTHTQMGYEGTCKGCKAELQRINRLGKLYNLTQDEYHRMIVLQGNTCAICGNTFGDKVCVDHDHSTGKVRGLLCDTCNRGIGLLKDDTRILLSAISYLREAGSCKIPLNEERPTG